MLPHPSVSRTHALHEKTPEGLRIRDLSSVNGVLVGGQRIRDIVMLQDNERVGIGPYLFFIVGDEIHAIDSSRSLRLEAQGLEKTIITTSGAKRQLLNNIRIAIEPGEFVALLGPRACYELCQDNRLSIIVTNATQCQLTSTSESRS
jgi:pSer/pThr/pTyr-binding forkhead associated (FHA) protein